MTRTHLKNNWEIGRVEVWKQCSKGDQGGVWKGSENHIGEDFDA